MKIKMLTTLLASAALVALPVERAKADAGDFIAGAIIGGIVGANAKKRKRTRSYRPAKKRSRLPSTNEGRQIQSALNYFGFNAGGVDGQLGRKSRTAISNYQAHMGYPVTGHLTDFEQNFLVNSHMRAQAGGAATMQQIAAHPMGSRGLLLAYRDALSGATTTVTTAPLQVAPTQPVALAPMAVAPVAVAVAPTAVAPAPQAVEPAPALPSLSVAASTSGAAALPNFLGGSSPVSLASHCNGISLLTNSNGGFTTVSSMTDSNFALNEQFCLARTYAIKQGEDMVAKLPGVTPQQISQQCEAFGTAMKDQIAAVSLKQQADVVRDTSSFILSTGMAPADLSGTAKICLSSGYRTDDMDVAIGSSLLLVALGEAVYGEMLGHHLSQGFGTSKRPDLAMSWYQSSTQALENGATAVFAPGQPERVELLKAAATGVTGGAPAQPQTVSTLPSFGAVDN